MHVVNPQETAYNLSMNNEQYQEAQNRIINIENWGIDYGPELQVELQELRVKVAAYEQVLAASQAE